MKILYVCADRAADPLHWSGTVFNCCNALRNAGAEVEIFDQLPFECPWMLRLLHQAYKRLSKKSHYIQVEPAILIRAARRIEQRFQSSGCDAIFCPGTGVPVYGYISPRVPVFTFLDATKFTWIESYFGISSLTHRSLRQVKALDRTALTNNTMTIFSSSWAAESAFASYGISWERTAVVPFGANLSAVPTQDEVNAWIEERLDRPVRMLFLGKEWDRKGGPEAVSLARELRGRGIEATLEIVGCVPELDASDRALCKIHGFIDHSSAAGLVELKEIMRRATFLLFLSRAEAFGIALCEAAAFGLPAFASRVGGIPTVVRDQETGLLADTPFDPATAASTLIELIRNASGYRAMARAVRRDFETRLNWNSAGRSLIQCIETGLQRRQ